MKASTAFVGTLGIGLCVCGASSIGLAHKEVYDDSLEQGWMEFAKNEPEHHEQIKEATEIGTMQYCAGFLVFAIAVMIYKAENQQWILTDKEEASP
jgi:hypothetical protein